MGKALYKQPKAGLRQVEESSSLACALARCSSRIMTCQVNDSDREISEGLRDLIAVIDCGWVVLWEITGNGRYVNRVHSSSLAGETAPSGLLAVENTSAILAKVSSNRRTSLFGLRELLKPEIPRGHNLLQGADNTAIAVTSLFADDLLIGVFLASAAAKAEGEEECLDHWQRIGEVFTGVLDHHRQRQILEMRIAFETLITDLSARLLAAEATGIDREIRASLDQVREFFHGDRCGLVRVDSTSAVCQIIYASYGEGITPLSLEINLAELLPWSYDRLVIQGHHKNYCRLADLPPEAAAEAAFWQARGSRSILTVPIFEAGNVTSLISIHTVHKEECWPDEYVARLRLLGEICLGAIRRREAERDLKDIQHRLEDQLREVKRLKEKVEKENLYLRTAAAYLSEQHEIIAESQQMRAILTQAEQVARTDSTVLITGETGTGKELVAKYIHKLSGRNGRPMVTVNCASLQPTLIESELFGREKGAYTGAMTRMAGRFEVADGSTIFLDEIGELPLDLQGKLLRVLEEGTFARLGSTKTIRVNVRVLAATNRDLQHEVQQGNFRRDLFYRLNVFPMVIPPLRNRLDDLAPLVWMFIRRFENTMGRQIEHIPQQCMDAMLHYPWPGNIRELRNVIEQAMIVCRDRTLEPFLMTSSAQSFESGGVDFDSAAREHILKVLKSCNWRISGPGGAAEILGMKRTTLQSKMRKLGIDRHS